MAIPQSGSQKQKGVFLCETAAVISPLMSEAFQAYLDRNGLQNKFEISFKGMDNLSLKMPISEDEIAVLETGKEKKAAELASMGLIKARFVLFAPFFIMPEHGLMRNSIKEYSWENLDIWGKSIIKGIERRNGKERWLKLAGRFRPRAI